MVSSIYACVNVVKMHIILHPPKGAKHLFPKQECPKKGHQHECFRVFGPFLAILDSFMSRFRQNLFSESKNVRFGDMRHPEIDYVACPDLAKTFKLKTRMPQKGTSDAPKSIV